MRLVLATLLLMIGAGRALFLVRVSGHSMSPTFGPGDLLLVMRLPRARDNFVRRGAVVVVAPPAFPSRLHLKRVIAVAGDTLPASSAVTMRVIPDGHIYVQGDGAHATQCGGTPLDSRMYGPCPLGAIRGLVVLRVHRAALARGNPQVHGDRPIPPAA